MGTPYCTFYKSAIFSEFFKMCSMIFTTVVICASVILGANGIAEEDISQEDSGTDLVKQVDEITKGLTNSSEAKNLLQADSGSDTVEQLTLLMTLLKKNLEELSVVKKSI